MKATGHPLLRVGALILAVGTGFTAATMIMRGNSGSLGGSPIPASAPAEASAAPVASAELWSRLVSSDRNVTAANLRRIGCPEETIARILADAPAIPAAPAARSMAETSSTPVVAPSAGTGVTPAPTMERLATITPVPAPPMAAPVVRQIDPAVAAGMAAGKRLVAARLATQATDSGREISGATNAAAAPAVDAPVVSAPTDLSVVDAPPIVAPAGDVAIPVAFQPTPEDARMSEVQRSQLDAIQQTFVQNIGGENQDPYSPDYRQLWKKAQRLSDEQFRALFGQQAFNERQIATELANRSSNAAN